MVENRGYHSLISPVGTTLSNSFLFTSVIHSTTSAGKTRQDKPCRVLLFSSPQIPLNITAVRLSLSGIQLRLPEKQLGIMEAQLNIGENELGITLGQLGLAENELGVAGTCLPAGRQAWCLLIDLTD